MTAQPFTLPIYIKITFLLLGLYLLVDVLYLAQEIIIPIAYSFLFSILLTPFVTFLEKKGQWIDSVHFPQSFRFSPFQGKGFYVLKGKVVEEFGVFMIEVSNCRKAGLKGRDN